MGKLLSNFINKQADILVLKLSVIFIFVLVYAYKWCDFEVVALEPIYQNLG